MEKEGHSISPENSIRDGGNLTKFLLKGGVLLAADIGRRVVHVLLTGHIHRVVTR